MHNNTIQNSTVPHDIIEVFNAEETRQENLTIEKGTNRDTENEGEEVTKIKLWKRIYGLGFILTIVKILIDGFTTMGIKKMSNMDPMVLVFLRSLVNLSFILPFSVYKDQPAFPPEQPLKDRFCLIYRGITGCFNICAQFYAYQNLPLGDTKMILALKPAFVTISARVFLKEPCGIFEFSNIIIMMVGILFVLQPPFIFTTNTNNDAYSSSGLHAGIIMCVVVFMSSNNTVILRHLRKSSVITLIFSRELIFTVESFILVMLLNSDMTTPSWQDKLKIVAIGASDLTIHVLHLLALKLEEASKISLVDKSGGIVIAYALQVIYFGEIPGAFTSVGICLVGVSIILVSIKKFVWEQNKPKKEDNISST